MTLIDDPDILKHSVTRDDPDVLNPGGHPQVLWLTFPNAAYLNAPTGVLPIDIPLPWSRARDRLLITTTLHETMWGAAIAKAIAKMITLGFTVEDRAKSERRTAMAQTRLLMANNGKGWTSFLWQHLSDYLLTDNGAFVELVYKSSDVRSQFLGFMHLDSLRVTRTGDPETPVIYEDLRGRMHELQAHQVLTFVDMESGRAEARGTGLCAASRAYPTIHKTAGMERYVSEKITGTGKQKGIHIINGVNAQQLQMALHKAEEDQVNRGLVSYRGVALIPLSAMTAKPDGYYIPLAEIPDGFSAKEERDNTYLKYANCIGLPLTDIQPLSGQGLGTGKQSEIIDDAGSEFGLAAWGKAWEHASNERIMPTTTTFSWADKSDARKQAASADVSLKRAQTRAAQVGSGEITPQQSLQLAADAGDVPDSFLQSDETPDDMLTDTEKPVGEGERDAMDANQPVPDQVPGTPPVTVPATTTATKARKLTIADLDDAQALKAAEKLYEEVQRG
jgi:hypothetical protein